MFNCKFSILASAVIAGAGLVALGIGIRKTKRANKAIKNIETTVDKLADMTSVEVSEMVIKAAAEKAADRAAAEAVETVRTDINLKVYTTVSAAYDDVEKTVRDRLEKTVERDIDMEKLSLKVENRASSAIVEKFMLNLDTYVGPIMARVLAAAKEET